MSTTESQLTLIVVLDTSALLPLLVGATHRAQHLRKHWQSRRFELCITPQILVEVERVLTYPKVQRNFELSDDDVRQVVLALQDHARMLPGLIEGVTAVEADPSDNAFLAAALEGGADYLVSQDPHLQNLKYFHGTQIISLERFAAILWVED